MDKNKFLLMALTLSSLFICLCLITETYAKYLSATEATTNTSIARWKILVNNEDITLGATSNAIITPVFPGNSHIASGVLAPNAEGYFDLLLDSSNVDVSFTYEIAVEINETSIIKELVATSYAVDGGNIIELEEDEIIEGTINLSDNIDTTAIRVYIKWDDSLDMMNNEADTLATKSGLQAKLDVSIRVIQSN